MDAQTALMFCNPDVPLENSLESARNLLIEEPWLDRELAKLLPTRGAHAAESISVAAALRVLEILDNITVGARLLPTLGHLAGHPDARLRSKAAALIGKRVKNLSWTQTHLADADARVRANVIESLWQENSPKCDAIYLTYRYDEDNRAAGNAIYGLYLRNHEQAQPAIRELSAHAEPRFRATAAWVIGKTGNAGLLSVLKPLLTDSEPGVRRAAFKALASLKSRAVAEPRATPAVA